MHDAVKVLKESGHLLNSRDQGFVGSLLSQLESRGKLSDKQIYWVDQMAQKVMELEQGIPDFTQPATIEVGNVAGILALFAKATKKLQYPKIRLSTAEGRTIVLSIAGPSAKYPGSINVMSGGNADTRDWYGRIQLGGDYEPRASLAKELHGDIAALLKQLAKDPAGTAAAYGKLTGYCCFCGSALTDEKSTAVGYGKTCAGHYGLPWGSVPKGMVCQGV